VKTYKRILAFDIGGTGLKAAVIDPKGKLISEHLHVATPRPAEPKQVVKLLVEMGKSIMPFDCISIGFPGVVKGTRVVTAPNLGTDMWAGFDLAGQLSKKFGHKPARLTNDADMQGLAVVRGKGLEFVMTLGTGFGTALFLNGELMPHMEIAHLPIHDGKDFDDYIGDRALKKIGKKKWNKRIEKILPMMYSLLHFDHVYIGGGNARHIDFKLPPHTSIVPNIAGIEGGAALWRHGDRVVVTALS